MHFTIQKGLDIPISGAPRPWLEPGKPVRHAALLGLDYVGLKPSMAVREGDQVPVGQLLFTDKKNPGVRFTAPVGGRIVAINRGPQRRFESMVIEIGGDDRLVFETGGSGQADPVAIKEVLVASGLWTALRARPFGKVPNLEAKPTALFVTAMATDPLAVDPAVVIAEAADDFGLGLRMVRTLAPKTYLCCRPNFSLPAANLPGITVARFSGPHPAGLAGTHIHFIEPVRQGKEVWHLGFQDVIAIGHLFRTGYLRTHTVIALAGPAMLNPRLIRTVPGAALDELCVDEFPQATSRLVSGSVLSGHTAVGHVAYLGRYDQQVCALPDRDGSGLFSWLRPGADRFSRLPVFLSAFAAPRAEGLAMSTAAWGGRRAIFPLGTYERVLPLNLVATPLLKSIAMGNTEKAAELGCLELVEEDLALCSFVCPGKNDFGPMLRHVLTRIEADG